MGFSAMEKRVLKTTPQGQAAVAVADRKDQATKLAKQASAAKTLAKAKGGDPKAKANIVKVHQMAKNGHPGAQEAVVNLHFMNRVSKIAKKVDQAYKSGVGNKRSLKKSKVANAYQAGIEP